MLSRRLVLLFGSFEFDDIGSSCFDPCAFFSSSCSTGTDYGEVCLASRDDDANSDLNKTEGDREAEERAGDGEEGQLCQDLDQRVSKGKNLC